MGHRMPTYRRRTATPRPRQRSRVYPSMERLPASPLSAAARGKPDARPASPPWVIGRRAARRETNWEAQAIGICVFVVGVATLFAGMCVLGHFLRPGF
jgi:hypothetical protein